MEQQPSDLEVIDIRYRYVGESDIHTGKLCLLPPEYRWLLDIRGNDLDGEEMVNLSQEWVDFDTSIFHYVDIAMGDTLDQLLGSNNPHGFVIVSYRISRPREVPVLEAMAATAMREYRAGLTQPLDPDALW